jgi:molecular chaperone DnaJ
MKKSPYVELGVESDALPEEIKLAYRRLARSTHPDVNPSSAARFRRVNAAYELLSDTNRRALFDRGNDWAVRMVSPLLSTMVHSFLSQVF